MRCKLSGRERHRVHDLLPLGVYRDDNAQNRLAREEIENRPGGRHRESQLHPIGITRTHFRTVFVRTG